nr:DNA-3-methyladenine glycosylase I [Liquorilactobacillus satsumensis]
MQYLKTPSFCLNYTDAHLGFHNIYGILRRGRPIINHWQFGNQLPEKTILSTKIAFELKKMGFNFVGPTLVYALMQSLGIVNDHLESCFYKYHKVINVSSEGRAQED